jgi:hypothetical protein
MSSEFDMEAKDGSWGLRIGNYHPRTQISLYTDIINIGKKGKEVKEYEYVLWQTHEDNTSWGSTFISHRVNPNMSLSQIKQEIEKLTKEFTEKNSKNQIHNDGTRSMTYKGVDKRLPEPSFADKFENKKQGNLSIFFKKPNITIVGEKESNEADKGHMYHHIEIDWNYAKKVNLIIDELLKSQSLNGVGKILNENGIKYKEPFYMDPQFA